MTNDQQELIKIFREVSNREDISIHTNLEDISLDSLEVLDVMAKINKQYNIEITVDDFVQSKNIMSLFEKIRATI
jgi:acyl carrier protein